MPKSIQPMCELPERVRRGNAAEQLELGALERQVERRVLGRAHVPDRMLRRRGRDAPGGDERGERFEVDRDDLCPGARCTGVPFRADPRGQLRVGEADQVDVEADRERTALEVDRRPGARPDLAARQVEERRYEGQPRHRLSGGCG